MSLTVLNLAKQFQRLRRKEKDMGKFVGLAVVLIGLVGCNKNDSPGPGSLDDIEAECKELGKVACEAKGVALLQDGGDSDNDAGVQYLFGACDLGSLTACTRLGQRFIGAGKGGSGIRMLEGACNKGHGDACRWAGEAYQAGVGGVPEDGPKAVDAYEKGCRAKDQAACFNRGAFYMTGRGGTPKDKARGLELMTAACRAGYSEGCGILATNGVDVSAGAGTGAAGGGAEEASVQRLAGIGWEVSGRLVDRLRLTKVKCEEPFRDKKMCHMTLTTSARFGKREIVWATVYDRSGAQTARSIITTPEQPGAAKQRIRVGVDTRKVVFDF